MGCMFDHHSKNLKGFYCCEVAACSVCNLADQADPNKLYVKRSCILLTSLLSINPTTPELKHVCCGGLSNALP